MRYDGKQDYSDDHGYRSRVEKREQRFGIVLISAMRSSGKSDFRYPTLDFSSQSLGAP